VGEPKPGGLSISAERSGERREIPWRGETPPKMAVVPKSSPYLVSPAKRRPGRKRMPRKEDLHRDFITTSFFLEKREKKIEGLRYSSILKKTYQENELPQHLRLQGTVGLMRFLYGTCMAKNRAGPGVL
jgi:hypothetical protein